MMVRRTFQFDSIYVIQFLADSDKPTGRKLFEGVVKPLASSAYLHANYAEVANREEFEQAFREIERDCESAGRQPILHLESHGSSEGLGPSAGQLMSWEELKPYLVRLNRHSRANLLVTLAACHGLHLAKTLITTDRAPVWAVIGPDHQVLPTDVSNCYAVFYREFLTDLDLNQALLRLRGADSSNPFTWKIQTAEVFFGYLFGEFMVQARSEGQRAKLRQNEQDMMATITLRRRMTAREAASVRREVRRRLEDYHADFDRMKNRFLMLDLFPENVPRFPVTYRQAVQLHAELKKYMAAEQELAGGESLAAS